jgi:hypothetical protein
VQELGTEIAYRGPYDLCCDFFSSTKCEYTVCVCAYSEPKRIAGRCTCGIFTNARKFAPAHRALLYVCTVVRIRCIQVMHVCSTCVIHTCVSQVTCNNRKIFLFSSVKQHVSFRRSEPSPHVCVSVCTRAGMRTSTQTHT